MKENTKKWKNRTPIDDAMAKTQLSSIEEDKSLNERRANTRAPDNMERKLLFFSRTNDLA